MATGTSPTAPRRNPPKRRTSWTDWLVAITAFGTMLVGIASIWQAKVSTDQAVAATKQTETALKAYETSIATLKHEQEQARKEDERILNERKELLAQDWQYVIVYGILQKGHQEYPSGMPFEAIKQRYVTEAAAAKEV